MVERVTFNGIVFRRYPDSPHPSQRRYFKPGIADTKRGVQALHQEIWKAAHGPIPRGHHVHHRDGNPSNNDLANLECLPAREHFARHAHDPVSPQKLAHLEAARPLAAEWHGSPEGRAWHAEHGRRGWVGRKPETHKCERCGAKYKTRAVQKHDRFCSNACKAAARRASGVDNETRACIVCGAAFTANRYAKTRTCSGGCAFKSRAVAR